MQLRGKYYLHGSPMLHASLQYVTVWCVYSWCNYSMQVVMRVLVVPPSQTLPSVPPNCLCLPLLTALLAATPPSVRHLHVQGC